MTTVIVISDTHAKRLSELPEALVDALRQADYVVHCGDYTALSLLQELRDLSRSFVGVHGNVDPQEVRDQVPAKAVFEVHGHRIGVIHPHWGGPPWGIEEDIAKEFNGVDIILYGHTHDIAHQTIDGVVFLNPGQGYPAFRTPASAAHITIDAGQLEIDIRTYG